MNMKKAAYGEEVEMNMKKAAYGEEVEMNMKKAAYGEEVDTVINGLQGMISETQGLLTNKPDMAAYKQALRGLEQLGHSLVKPARMLSLRLSDTSVAGEVEELVAAILSIAREGLFAALNIIRRQEEDKAQRDELAMQLREVERSMGSLDRLVNQNLSRAAADGKRVTMATAKAVLKKMGVTPTQYEFSGNDEVTFYPDPNGEETLKSVGDAKRNAYAFAKAIGVRGVSSNGSMFWVKWGGRVVQDMGDYNNPSSRWHY